MFDKSRCRELLQQHLDGTLDAGGRNELFKLSADVNIEELLAEMIDADFSLDQTGERDLSADIAENILSRILASEENTNRLFSRSIRRNLVRRFSIAAVFLIIVLGTAFLFFRPVKVSAPVAFEAFVPKSIIKKINNTSLPMILELEDGSTVKLAPNASLSFPQHFVPGKREVYMTGEAFFQVAKNPNAPFFVYYNNIVTRVLGTSFNIKTNPHTKNVEVSVVSGKVQVIENKYLTPGNATTEEAKSVIVIPNQKATYNDERRDFETTLADSIQALPNFNDKPGYAPGLADTDSFYFPKATNLKQVFSQLEAVYGVKIIVNNEFIYNCVFTGDISKQDMWKKLNIICLTVGSTYEIKGTNILVSGKGCN